MNYFQCLRLMGNIQSSFCLMIQRSRSQITIKWRWYLLYEWRPAAINGTKRETAILPLKNRDSLYLRGNNCCFKKREPSLFKVQPGGDLRRDSSFKATKLDSKMESRGDKKATMVLLRTKLTIKYKTERQLWLF